jgi:hypothetical protein
LRGNLLFPRGGGENTKEVKRVSVFDGMVRADVKIKISELQAQIEKVAKLLNELRDATSSMSIDFPELVISLSQSQEEQKKVE